MLAYDVKLETVLQLQFVLTLMLIDKNIIMSLTVTHLLVTYLSLSLCVTVV